MSAIAVGFAKQPISACCNPEHWPVHNDLFAGALWVDAPPAAGGPALLCPLDHAELGGHQVDLLKDRLASELGLNPARIVVTFSHTHACGTVDIPALAAVLVATARAARQAARPARVRFVRAEVGRSFSVNRRLDLGGDLGVLTITFFRENRIDRRRSQIDAAGQARDFLRYGVNLYHPAYERAGPNPGHGPARPSPAQHAALAALPPTLYLERPVDPHLEALCFEDAAHGRALGTVIRFACHPVIFTGPVISADYPGVLTAAWADRTGAPALFVNGPSGDLKPLVAENGPKEMKRVGLALAEHLDRARASAAPAESLKQFTFNRREDWFNLCPDMLNVPAAATDRLAADYAAAAAQSFDPVALRRRLDALLRTWAAGPDCYGVELQPRMLFSATCWRFNDIRLATLPGEMFQAFGARLRQEFSGFPLMTAELADTDRTGYVPTRDDFPRGGYEVAASCLPPGSGERLTDLAAELLRV